MHSRSSAPPPSTQDCEQRLHKECLGHNTLIAIRMNATVLIVTLGHFDKIAFLASGNWKTTITCRSRQTGAIHQLLRAHFVAMPQALSPQKSLAVAAGLQLNLAPDSIEVTTSVSKRQIRWIKRNISVYGSIRKPKVVKQGRKSKITDEMAEVGALSMYEWRC